ncbi:sensor histidine kinase [Bacillus sp. FJAT-27445]|uniref:sensor histidine kinase n=1 Tax=Bacillus sp. FJAT-27445 TaxID=1679166 RepID=UPI00074398DA|nr:sensor histidine kinase [Bacillus sp. FJAT-27445]
MLPIQKETHWVHKTAQIIRICWFIFHLLALILLMPSVQPFWLVLSLFFAAFLLPQWSGTNPTSFGVKNYPLLELVFSGLFLIVGCYLLGKYSSFLAYPALCAGLYSRPGKQRWFGWAGFSIAPLLAVLAIGLDHLGMGVIDGFFFFGIGIAIAKVLEAEKKTRSLLEENRRQNRLLEEYAKQVKKITLLEERNRLARDLHDTIGHTFTSVIMGLDATAYLLEASPAKAKEQVNQLSGVMRNSLGEIRSHIHQIAPADDTGEFSDRLRTIASEFSSHTKVEVNFIVLGQEREISSQGAITFVRCLQEALTNAVRHGGAKKISITLKEEGHYIVLAIVDNGIGMGDSKEGFGLKGMKARLESLQGGLSIESKDQEGTAITCYLPAI